MPRRLLLLPFILICVQCGLVAADPLRVVATIKPLQMIATAVAGQGATVDSLLDPRLSPHDYQLKPSDRIKLERADIVFWVGPGLELFLQQALRTLPGQVQVTALQPHGNHEQDAHIWMNPVAAAEIAGQMATALAALDPQRAADYRTNAARIQAALTIVDGELQREFGSITRRRGYLVSHDAFARLEQRYGVQHVAALSDGHERPPGPRHLLQLRELVSSGQVGCVLLEPQYDRKLVDTVVQDARIKQVVVDTLAGSDAADVDGLLSFYRGLGKSLAQCVRD